MGIGIIKLGQVNSHFIYLQILTNGDVDDQVCGIEIAIDVEGLKGAAWHIGVANKSDYFRVFA